MDEVVETLKNLKSRIQNLAYSKTVEIDNQEIIIMKDNIKVKSVIDEIDHLIEENKD